MINLTALNVGDTFADEDGQLQQITAKMTDENDVVVGVAYQPVI